MSSYIMDKGFCYRTFDSNNFSSVTQLPDDIHRTSADLAADLNLVTFTQSDRHKSGNVVLSHVISMPCRFKCKQGDIEATAYP